MSEGIPPWMAVALLEQELRVQELPGSEHEARIIMYHSTTSLDAEADEVPWCSSFVNYCAQMCGMGLRGTQSARARSWLEWGSSLSYPALGCIAVLKRGGPDQPGKDVLDAAGHVGFFAGFDRQGKPRILAGNQSNRVNTKPFPVERILDYRWLK